MPPVEHVYTSDLCKNRVLWAWSRRPEQVHFSEEAVQAILEASSKMSKKYSSRIPLVEPADQRLKIARLSVAAAACVYSTDDGTNILVEPDHVDFVVNYLNTIYDSKAMGYDKLSADDFENSDTTENAMDRLRTQFLAIPFVSREPAEVARSLYQLNYFDRNTLEDATGLDREELKELLHFLINNSVIERVGKDYKRTPMGLAFIEYLLLNPADISEIAEARRKRFQNSEI